MKTSTHEPAVINHLQENLYRILEEEETGTHPIDYLYSEFKKLKLCKH